MSAVSLACRLSLRQADGTTVRLPRFRASDNPLTIRAHLLAFYELRDAARRERAALVGVPGSLRDRLALGVVLDEIGDALDAAREVLRTIARRGGRGLPAPGAGRSPAVEGHGCPASAPGAQPPVSAVGPALTVCHGADITVAADPLLAVRGMQELPGVTPGDTLNLTGEKLP